MDEALERVRAVELALQANSYFGASDVAALLANAKAILDFIHGA